MIKLVFWGTPSFAVPSLQRLIADPAFTVLGVVTQPDRRRGRGSQLVPSPVKQQALAYGLPVWQPERVKKDRPTLEALRLLAADVFVVVAYGQLLSPEILEMPRLGCINAHGSLLPAYRGAAPIQWSVWNGDSETGITTMLMEAGMDTGPMLLKQSIPIPLFEDAATVGIRLAEVAAELLVLTLQGLDQGTLTPEPQNDALATYARPLTKADFLIHWSNPALALHNQVRAVVPQAIARFQGQPLKVLQTVPLASAYLRHLPTEYKNLVPLLEASDLARSGAAPPGTVVYLAKNAGPVVQTGQDWLLLSKVQPAGRRPQSGWEFANGLRLQVGDSLNNGILPSA